MSKKYPSREAVPDESEWKFVDTVVDEVTETVPAKLRECAQWICWRTELRENDDGTCRLTKAPIKPYADRDGTVEYTQFSLDSDANTDDWGESEAGHPYAASNKPHTWRSFDEALAYHRSDEHDERTNGIGFVFADGLQAGVDFDNVRAVGDDGIQIEPWAREAIETLDSYTEISPSGTGLHTHVLATSPGDRTRRTQESTLDAFDDAEIEMYTEGRFFTVTGDRVDLVSPRVEQRNDELAAVWAEYIHSPDDQASLDDATDDAGSNEPEAQGDTDAVREALDDGADKPRLADETLLEKAANAKNGEKFIALFRGDDSYHGGDTSAADQAFCNMLAFWTGHNPVQMDRLFRESKRMRGKWDDQHFADGATYGEGTIAEAITFQDEAYDPSGGSDPSEAAPDADPEREPPADEDAAAVSEETAVERQTDPDAPDEMSVEHGGYYHWKQVNGEWRSEMVTNFRLTVVAFLAEPDDDGASLGGASSVDYYHLRVTPREGAAYEVTVHPRVFNDVRRFADAVACGRTAAFDGSKSDLAKLKEFVGTQDAPTYQATTTLGLHEPAGDGGDPEFVLPAGVLSPEGWAADPVHRYKPEGVDFESKVTLTPETPDFDREAVAEILELLPQTRSTERFLPVLGWFYAATCRPYIMDWTGQFNLLSIKGDTGAGKSATLQTLWELFGVNDDPMSVTDTRWVLTRTLAASNALPLWYDEYKPSDLGDGVLKRFHEFLRKSTRGGVETRGTADMGTEGHSLTAPIVVSGEERMQGSAEERRGVFTTFRKDVTRPDTDTAAAFMELTGNDGHPGYDFAEHALAWHTWLLSQDKFKLYKWWREAGDHVDDLVAGLVDDPLEELVLQGLQTVAFGCDLYNRFARAMGHTDPLIADGDVDAAIEYVVCDSVSGVNRKSHVDTFLEIAARAAYHDDGGLYEGIHYTVVNQGTDDAELRLLLKESFDKVRQYAYRHDSPDDLLNSPDDYRDRIADLVDGDEPTYFTSVSEVTHPMNQRCVAIDIERAEEMIDNFSAVRFEGASAGDTVTSLSAIEGSEGFVTVTVEVASLSTPDHDKIAQQGMFKDTSGFVDYLAWASDDLTLAIEEGSCYRLKNLRATTDPDGTPQLKPSPMTEVEPIEAGVELAPAADPGANDTLDSEGTDAAADGGHTPPPPPEADGDGDGDGDGEESADTEPAEPAADPHGGIEKMGRDQREVVLGALDAACDAGPDDEDGAPYDMVVTLAVGRSQMVESSASWALDRLLEAGVVYERPDGLLERT